MAGATRQGLEARPSRTNLDLAAVWAGDAHVRAENGSIERHRTSTIVRDRDADARDVDKLPRMRIVALSVLATLA